MNQQFFGVKVCWCLCGLSLVMYVLSSATTVLPKDMFFHSIETTIELLAAFVFGAAASFGGHWSVWRQRWITNSLLLFGVIAALMAVSRTFS